MDSILENTRLTDPRRVKKLIAVLAIGFCWCYLTGEWQHDRKKAIKNKEAWTTFSKFILHGLDYVQMAILRLIGFGKKKNLSPVLVILRKKSLIGQGPYEICRTENQHLLKPKLTNTVK